MTLEIDPQAEPIAGRVGIDGEAARDFTGWMDLTRLVEELRADSRAQRPPV